MFGPGLSTLASNVHEGLCGPGDEVHFVKGTYQYYHYGCDGVDDRGWGCGYRTLQTLSAWVRDQLTQQAKQGPQTSVAPVPSISKIQETLVTVGDKPASFQGSREWIGSFEICLCLDSLFDVPCKIVHVKSGSDLTTVFPELIKHFMDLGSPVMMGGSTDNSSKGIVGICSQPPALLVLDPHIYGVIPSKEDLQSERWISWRTLDYFSDQSFYNICLPQLKGVT